MPGTGGLQGNHHPKTARGADRPGTSPMLLAGCPAPVGKFAQLSLGANMGKHPGTNAPKHQARLRTPKRNQMRDTQNMKQRRTANQGKLPESKSTHQARKQKARGKNVLGALSRFLFGCDYWPNTLAAMPTRTLCGCAKPWKGAYASLRGNLRLRGVPRQTFVRQQACVGQNTATRTCLCGAYAT